MTEEEGAVTERNLLTDDEMEMDDDDQQKAEGDKVASEGDKDVIRLKRAIAARLAAL